MKVINMVLGCVLAATWLSAVPLAPTAVSGGPVALGESRMVTLMHAPGTSTLRVPLPEAFTRLQSGAKDAKAATVTIRFLPAGSHDTHWGDNAIAWPSDAKAAVTYAASVWGSLLNSPVPIVIDAAWVNNLAVGVLGHSGTLNFWRGFTGEPVPNTWYPATLANALYGSDIDPDNSDVYMGFSSVYNW